MHSVYALPATPPTTPPPLSPRTLGSACGADGTGLQLQQYCPGGTAPSPSEGQGHRAARLRSCARGQRPKRRQRQTRQENQETQMRGRQGQRGGQLRQAASRARGRRRHRPKPSLKPQLGARHLGAGADAARGGARRHPRTRPGRAQLADLPQSHGGAGTHPGRRAILVAQCQDPGASRTPDRRARFLGRGDTGRGNALRQAHGQIPCARCASHPGF